MTIEVKQLLIKSNVVQRETSEYSDDNLPSSLDKLKEEIISECKMMLIDLLNEKGER